MVILHCFCVAEFVKAMVADNIFKWSSRELYNDTKILHA